MRKFLIISMALFFSAKALCQDADSVLRVAENAFEVGNIRLAQKEIQRAILFDTLNRDFQKYCAAAQIFAAAGESRNAEIFVNQAYNVAKNNFERRQVLFTKANIYIAAKNYFNAAAVLAQLDTTQSQEQILRKIKHQKYPSPLAAGLLSAVLPGAGQYYSFSFVDGLSSQVILGSLTLLGIYLAQNYGNWTAVLCVLPWLQRYYIGGIRNAVLCARNKRDAQIGTIFAIP